MAPNKYGANRLPLDRTGSCGFLSRIRFSRLEQSPFCLFAHARFRLFFFKGRIHIHFFFSVIFALFSTCIFIKQIPEATGWKGGADGDGSIGPMALGSVGWVMPGSDPSDGWFYGYRDPSGNGGLYLPDKRYGIGVPHLQEVKKCERLRFFFLAVLCIIFPFFCCLVARF